MVVALKGQGFASSKEEMEHILNELKTRGFTGTFHTGSQFLKLHAPQNKRMIDLFPVINMSENAVGMYMENLELREVPRDVVLPFDRIQFLGEEFWAPASADGFLTERYGETWRTPLRKVGSQTVAGTA